VSTDPPLRWREDGGEEALVTAEALRTAATAGVGAALPAGWTVVKDRPMRLVARGPVPGPVGPIEAFAKVRRPASVLDRAKAALRFPRSVAEGALLLELAALGVAVPRVLGWSVAPEGDVEVLLLEAVPDSIDLATWERAHHGHAERREVASGVAMLLRAAHDVGWADRDLHRGNVLWTPRGAVLVDPGTEPLRGPLPEAARTSALAVAAHGLAPDVRTGLRALRAYGGGDRAEARRRLPSVLRAARRRTRAWRRARARRATRPGRHFDVVRDPQGRFTCVRALPHAPAAWIGAVPALLEATPAGARALKADGRVFAIVLPGRAAEAVVKRFDPAWRERFRTPRALRAFRRAYALRVRGVGCPEPLLAAATPAGAGVCISALAGPPGADPLDLWRSVNGTGDGRPSRFGALSASARRLALERVGRFLRRIHDADVSHRDLKAANLVGWTTPRGPAFAVVDLEGARLRDRSVPWARRARDLGRLDASLGAPVSRADRRRVLRGYYSAFARPGLPLSAFARLVARASARKRGPGGGPR